MKVAIIGSRSFVDREKFRNEMEKLNLNVTQVISGGAAGTDSLAEEWARQNKIPTEIYLPDWEKFGKSAGYRRNTDIIENCDFCVAFWDGKSKGTLHSISIAKNKGVNFKIIFV